MSKKTDRDRIGGLSEYRCTRPDMYPEGTPSEHMQGHYIVAMSEWDARAIMVQKFPTDRQCMVKFFRKIAVSLSVSAINVINEGKIQQSVQCQHSFYAVRFAGIVRCNKCEAEFPLISTC